MTNIISGNKMLGHIDRIFGEHRPITADIFLTNYCNNLCPYCTYRRWEFEDGARSISYNDFVAYATRLLTLGVKGIILTGGGEPTLNRDFDAICDWLVTSEIAWGINTNFNVLKYIKPNYLKVSLDGWSRDSYIQHRGVDAYEIVRENIKQYVTWKKINSPNTSVGIQLLAKSVSAVQLFYEANKDLPVDYIVIRPMESIGGEYYKNITDVTSELHPVNIIKAINDITLIDSRVVLNYKWNLLSVLGDSCVAAWAQMSVNEAGYVTYCCHKPYQIIGHILDADILKKKAAATTDMQTCDIPCRLTGPNNTVSKLLTAQGGSEFI